MRADGRDDRHLAAAGLHQHRSTTAPTAATWTFPELGPGCTLLLPVAVPGAPVLPRRLPRGAGRRRALRHRRDRDPDATRRSASTSPRGPGMAWPRFETATHIGAIAWARPLEDAFRLSVEELVAWLGEDHGLSARGRRDAAWVRSPRRAARRSSTRSTPTSRRSPSGICTRERSDRPLPSPFLELAVRGVSSVPLLHGTGSTPSTRRGSGEPPGESCRDRRSEQRAAPTSPQGTSCRSYPRLGEQRGEHLHFFGDVGDERAAQE